MNKTKESIITGFALFSMFFGAGNLILPPYLGKLAGAEWLIVLIGFCITAVVIPILGIYAHAKLQGSMFDFAKHISTKFSWVYCFIIYLIAIALPLPRTAAVTHEISIQPLLDIPSWGTSLLYFGLAYILVINRSKLIDILGKYLTPILLLALTLTIVLGISNDTAFNLDPSQLKGITSGILEGYQTFDAIGAIVSGGILVISVKFNTTATYSYKKTIISRAGIIAGIALICFYGGLMFVGAKYSSHMSSEVTRTALLTILMNLILGPIGKTLLSVLVGIACFTTAVSIIAGTADFVQGYFNKNKNAFKLTTALACIIGVIVGQFDVHYIITTAIPVLLIIYPITITLIILNALPRRFNTPYIFRTTVMVCILFTIPDVLNHFQLTHALTPYFSKIPLSQYSLGWCIPTAMALMASTINTTKPKRVDQLE